MHVDVEKTIDLMSEGAIRAGGKVLEFVRNHALTPIQVTRRVVNYTNGLPSGDPYERILNKTQADLISHDTMVSLLKSEFPEYPILSEEEYINSPATPIDTPYFIVDPIDGTIHLEKGSPQWTINVALCMNGVPLVGVVVVPQENKIFVGARDTPSRWRECTSRDGWHDLTPEIRDRDNLIVSKCHPLDLGGEDDPVTEAILALNNLSRSYLSGSAYRYLEVARGAVDVIVHGAGNFLWDKAAAQVIIEGTHGALIELPWGSMDSDGENILAPLKDGVPLRYLREQLKDEGHLVVSSNAREGLSTLIIPKTLDRRHLWKFVIS